MPNDELPCFECEHADMSCGEISCAVAKRAIRLLDECPLGNEL